MTHGSLSTVCLKHQGKWKKRLVSPIEKSLLRNSSKIVATCEAEAHWIRSYLGICCLPIEVTDLKRFFKLTSVPCSLLPVPRPLHLLYLGRRHPLKGLEYLKSALDELNGKVIKQVRPVLSLSEAAPSTSSGCSTRLELKVVSNAFGGEKETVWQWADVLVLPTLSDNFGLVIAEALERGKHVITTDGAPAWGDGNTYGGRLTYLRGYRDGTPEQRVSLLISAIEDLICTHSK